MKNQFLKIWLLAFFTMCFASVITFNAHAQKASGPLIRFSSKNYKQVLASAKASQKMIFVDAVATWCAPCN